MVLVVNPSLNWFFIFLHIDYEMKRLKRGKMTVPEMRTNFPQCIDYQCVEDEDYDDNIIMRMLDWEQIITG